MAGDGHLSAQPPKPWTTIEFQALECTFQASLDYLNSGGYTLSPLASWNDMDEWRNRTWRRTQGTKRHPPPVEWVRAHYTLAFDVSGT